MTSVTTAGHDVTICLLRNGSGLDLDRYVARTFKTADDAHRFAAAQYRYVTIRRIAGSLKVGDRVPFNTPTQAL